MKESCEYPRFSGGLLSIGEQVLRLEVLDYDGESISVRATLEDLHHDIEIDLTLSANDRQVTAVAGRMQKSPYGERCLSTVGLLDDLVGQSFIEKVYPKALHSVGGRRGCLHLVDMVVDAVVHANTALNYRGYSEMQSRGASQEEIRRHYARVFPNTCTAYAADADHDRGRLDAPVE